MPIFDQDETSSGDIFEQQRRRKRKNDAVDSEGTSYNRTGSQRGPGKNTGGALSPGAFVTERARKEKMEGGEKATPTFYTSSGSFQSGREERRNPRQFTGSRTGYNRLGQRKKYKSTITTGTGNNRQTYGFTDKYKAAAASRAVARRNKVKQGAMARLKDKTGATSTRGVFDLKSHSTPGGDTMTNHENQGLSFGEKVQQKASLRYESGEKGIASSLLKAGRRFLKKNTSKATRKALGRGARKTDKFISRNAVPLAAGAAGAGGIAVGRASKRDYKESDRLGDRVVNRGRGY